MKDNVFNFCPDCGSKNIQTLLNGRKWFCPDCGFDLYNNVASAVGVVIENSKGEILFEKRAKNPRKGFLALPGGFCEPDETAEQSAVRECREEVGLEVCDIKFLCSFPNTYVYRDIIYKTCDIFFTAKIKEGAQIKMDESEVSEYVWVSADTMEEIEKIPLAFDSAKKTLLKRIEK
ncbi:MAG: NUDIX domain-containing protein [Treponema sp.]|nr:NUDIX domain-containing protein [Treponema sp.]